MKKQIVSLIYEYAKDNKPIDMKFIERIIGAYVTDRQLQQYVEKVEWETGDTAAYVFFTKTIKVHPEIYEKTYEFVMNNISGFDTRYEELTAVYMRVAQAILHELEHASQFRTVCSENHDTVEAKLLAASLEWVLTKLDNYDLVTAAQINKYLEERYHKYVVFDPAERLANIRSWRTIGQGMSEMLDRCTFKLFSFAIINENANLFRAYMEIPDRTMCPAEYFLKETDHIGTLRELGLGGYGTTDYRRKFDFSKRLELGLEISPVEYYQAEAMYDSFTKVKK